MSMHKRKIWLWIGILVILLIAGYLVVDGLIRKKVETAFGSLPASLQAGYSSLHVNLLRHSLVIDSLYARGIGIARVSAEGIGFWDLWRHRRLALDRLLLRDVRIAREEKDTLPRSIPLPGSGVDIGKIEVDGFRYVIPGADEVVIGRHMELDSRQRTFRVDTLHIQPADDKMVIGRRRGHQVDVVDATCEGISAEGLEAAALFRHELKAKMIQISGGRVHIFRDRRLPLVEGEKRLPIDELKALPVTLRVGEVKMGPTYFSYEEYPAKGDQTGELKIFRLRGHMTPLINRPETGDPDYITVRMEGSLMNSGSVTATTLMPLHKDDPYRVEGAFHELDVTKLNDPAEHLGHLHLESGMLNFLDFRFEMTAEKATGRIIGEYHNLVVDKLKDNGMSAVLKSWALKKFIVPRNKDKRLAVKKRTGKVDYKRDPQRYFSYYLLHSLLVGIKSSFSLGFLLPG